MSFIVIAKFLGLYKNIVWHASTEQEAQDIKSVFSAIDKEILIALNLPSIVISDTLADNNQPLNDEKVSRIIFLSRISPKKNLDYALRTFLKVTKPIIFDIYGPIEDDSYWKECQLIINKMPKNVIVSYCGALVPKDIPKTFASYNLFFFPTHGENYGHVIAESLSVGTPVLLSDQTPWRDLEADGLGWDIPLNNINAFVKVLEKVALQTVDEKSSNRQHICEKITKRLTNTDVIEANRQLFYQSIQKTKKIN